MGYSSAYYEGTLYNYFIPCLRKYPGKQSMRHRMIKRLELYSDWLYFLWHDIVFVWLQPCSCFPMINSEWAPTHSYVVTIVVAVVYNYLSLGKVHLIWQRGGGGEDIKGGYENLYFKTNRSGGGGGGLLNNWATSFEFQYLHSPLLPLSY